MHSLHRQREIVREIQGLSLEAVSLDELGEQILPRIENLFETSASLLYRCDADPSLAAVGGTLIDICEAYGQSEDSVDPLHPEESRLNLPVSVLSRLKVWKSYLRSSAFHEYMHPRDADYLLHLRLTDTDFHAPGMVGLVLARTFKQPDFGKKDEKALLQILDPLRAVARRGNRLEARLVRTQAILDSKSRDEIALSLSGRFIWASGSARARLGWQSRREKLPEALVAAARRIGDSLRDDSAIRPGAARVALLLKDGSQVQADLRLVHSPAGEDWVLAELESQGIPPGTLERLRPFDLTHTELKVLGLLAQGLSDEAIGRRLFVSHATIRTHVGNILGKLGVPSRVQAALLVHGFLPKIDS